MRVSVLICTWNRAALLDKTLDEVARLRVPAGVDWEVLVVNNACTDDTDAVLARHVPLLPLTRLHEPRPGKAHAANLAVQHSRGDLLVWTDDDVRLDPGWLQAYVHAADQWPRAGFFGGPIEPLFEVEPARWIRRNLEVLGPVFGRLEPGPGMRLYDEKDQPPNGANMAMRRSALEGVRFNVDIGVRHGDQTRGEETELLHRLIRAGHQGVWVGPARVLHHVPPERASPPYLWGYFLGLGRCAARLEFGRCFPTIAGLPRWALRRYVTARMVMGLLGPLADQRWARAYRTAGKMRGFLSEWRRLRHRLPSAAIMPSPESHPPHYAR
jgi:glycosyltransferase involved in cell wall biosynthesis